MRVVYIYTCDDVGAIGEVCEFPSCKDIQVMYV